MRYRYENFGGIVASEEPPFLAFVDRAFMREIGAAGSPAWDTDDESIGLLSAPTEIHLACTNRCNVRCPHCYMDSGAADAGELDTAALKRALAAAADMGVFHVALGGGEALLREDLFEIARFAREVGLVPNLTTSGIGLTAAQAERMAVFGQVNLSLDGTGAASGVFRGRDVSADVDRALGLLSAAGIAAGINCVLGRRTFPGIGDLFAWAADRGAGEIEFLRLKPAGRGAAVYEREKMTFEQNVRLLPVLTEHAAATNVTAKIDCSLVPMLCYHDPPRDLLDALATFGCEAGNVLAGVRSDGSVAGCSFLPDTGIAVADLADAWHDHPALRALRSWTDRAPEPCRSCDYLDLCRGGCRAVARAAAAAGDDGPVPPDPDCPRVEAYRRAARGGGW